MARTAGPMMMPRTISITTSGTDSFPVSSDRIGDSTATTPIKTNVPTVVNVTCPASRTGDLPLQRKYPSWVMDQGFKTVAATLSGRG
jgi:hypothetical protein